MVKILVPMLAAQLGLFVAGCLLGGQGDGLKREEVGPKPGCHMEWSDKVGDSVRVCSDPKPPIFKPSPETSKVRPV
jgi:hypothetical protein